MSDILLPKPQRRARKPKGRIRRKKPPNPFSQRGRAVLRKVADKLLGRYVRLRYSSCICGLGIHAGQLQAAHGFPKKAYPAVRHDPENIFLLCARGHKWFTHRPQAWTEWLIQRLGEAEYRALRERALTTAPRDISIDIERLQMLIREH